MEDQRFAHVKTDPKFRRIPKGARKVKIDSRFKSMFKDKQFKVKYTVDKRGRPVNHTSTEDLKRYYDLSDSSSDEETDDKSELSVKDKTDKVVSDEIKKKLRNLSVDYARGESSLLTESSSDDDDDEDDEVAEGDDIEHNWGELDNDAEKTEDATFRLAACNMDWDRIRAMDLMVLFNSFLPPGGAVKSVTIYPSEFGKKRMVEEDVKGPIELVENKLNEEDGEEGAKYHMEKLRQYQLNRLKYYYAVIVFDSATTANKVYSECDGMEYESSATKLDLRFIPDDMCFDDEAKEQCDKLPELNKYQPRFFTTTALQQAKVDLTWDETDPSRIELTQKISSGKIEDISENDLHNYVAVSEDEESGSSEECDDDDDNPIEKYKQLLQDIENKEDEKKNREVEMEVSWGIDLKSKTEKLVRKKIDEDTAKTPFEKYLDKRKEKRKEKKKQRKGGEDSDDIPSDVDMNDPFFAEEFNNPEFKQKKKKKEERVESDETNPELELLLLNEDEDKSHFSLKKIQKQEEVSLKKKRKKKDVEGDKADDFQINVDDDRFSALYTSHLYNIDPTSPHYKKTKGIETLINEKIKRRKDEDSNNEPVVSKKKDAELSVLVKSVKRKAQALKNKKR
ncbi:hypothetical protein Zmor_009563 [Zophobas morio]|uniref:ESF1-like protein n=1 Tax=Zophobas morio TaxID=2755281 RepID=A0AA38ILX5_9CUCU|nr:hypothetical protein Zmor_009563 [Zophobas morio]